MNDTQQVVFKSENSAAAFFKEHEELASTEVNVSKVKVDLEKIGDAVPNMSVEELQKLAAVLEF